MFTQQELINEFYGGDVRAYDNQRKYGKKTALRWQDVQKAVEIYPEHLDSARYYIDIFLGYLPDELISMPHMAFLQSIIEQFMRGSIAENKFFYDVKPHIKNIRNDDMKKGGWVKEPIYMEYHYQAYDTLHVEYKYASRERLTTFLGYEPDLNFSLAAEVNLRKMFYDETVNPNGWNKWDYKMAMIVKYREVFMKEGEAFADKIPLFLS